MLAASNSETWGTTRPRFCLNEHHQDDQQQRIGETTAAVPVDSLVVFGEGTDKFDISMRLLWDFVVGDEK